MYSYMHFHMENIVVFLYYYIIMYRYICIDICIDILLNYYSYRYINVTIN